MVELEREASVATRRGKAGGLSDVLVDVVWLCAVLGTALFLIVAGYAWVGAALVIVFVTALLLLLALHKWLQLVFGDSTPE